MPALRFEGIAAAFIRFLLCLGVFLGSRFVRRDEIACSAKRVFQKSRIASVSLAFFCNSQNFTVSGYANKRKRLLFSIP